MLLRVMMIMTKMLIIEIPVYSRFASLFYALYFYNGELNDLEFHLVKTSG